MPAGGGKRASGEGNASKKGKPKLFVRKDASFQVRIGREVMAICPRRWRRSSGAHVLSRGFLKTVNGQSFKGLKRAASRLRGKENGSVVSRRAGALAKRLQPRDATPTGLDHGGVSRPWKV